jgi:hypothetical protein
MKHVARSLSRWKGEVRRKVGPLHFCMCHAEEHVAASVPETVTGTRTLRFGLLIAWSSVYVFQATPASDPSSYIIAAYMYKRKNIPSCIIERLGERRRPASPKTSHQVNASSTNSIFLVLSCLTPALTSSENSPGPQTLTPIQPIWVAHSLLIIAATSGRPGNLHVMCQ